MRTKSLKLDSRTIGHWVINIDKDWLYWDSTMCAIFGFKDKHKTGDFRMFSDLVHKDDLNRVVEIFQEAVNKFKKDKNDNTHYMASYRVICGDVIKIVHARGSIVEINGDLHMYGSCDEVTEQTKLRDSILSLLDKE